MIVKINNIDVSNQVIAPTMKGVKNSNFQNDFSFSILSDDKTLRAGMEVEIFEDNGTTKMIGGLMQQPVKSLISPTKMLQSINCTGYKQILARRSLNVYVVDQNSGDVVEQAFDDFLAVGSDYSEELTKGTIDTGVNIENYIGVYSAFKFFTDMAQISGLRWWVDDDKVFNFTTKPTYTTVATKLTDEDIVDRFEILDYPSYKEDLSKYRNRQYMIGRDEDGLQIIGQAIDSTEEARLKALYGSGVYSNIMRNDNVKTQTDADAAALAELNAYSIIPAEIMFKTRDFVDVNQKILVHLDAYGVDDEYFISDEIEFSYDNTDEFLVYTVTLKKHIDTAKQVSSWTEDWNTALNDVSQTEKPEDTVNIVEVSNVAAYTAFTTETALDSIDVDFKEDTIVNFQVRADLLASAAAAYTVKLRVDGVAEKTTTWYVADINKDGRIFTGAISGIAAGTKTVDVTITPASGNGTIALDEYQLTLIIADTTVEPPPVISETNRLYSGTRDGRDYIYELDFDTLVQINSASRTTDVFGVGGIAGRLFYHHPTTISEVDIDTLADINLASLSSSAQTPRGLGGTADKLYHAARSSDLIYEVDPDTLALISSVGGPGTAVYGVGGMKDRLYCCDVDTDKLYELDTSTLASINVSGATYTGPAGIGGINKRLYMSAFDDTVYEVDPDTLAVINTVSIGGYRYEGIGGVK